MLEVVSHLSGRVAYLQDHEAVAVGAPSYDRVICGILEHFVELAHKIAGIISGLCRWVVVGRHDDDGGRTVGGFGNNGR